MITPEILAALAGSGVAVGILVTIAGALPRDRSRPSRAAAPLSPWSRRLRAISAAARTPYSSPGRQRWRLIGWSAAGIAVWIVSAWPVAGLAVAVVGIWLPWLLGSARVAQARIDQLEALETWCRRMADTLTGGGAIGLAQAVVVTAPHVDGPTAPAVHALARQLRDGTVDVPSAVRGFADAIDDRVGDTVAAALMLALHQQSAGVARVLRQLADGVARDVRARREIEAARAESRQSIRMLLIIQAGLLALLALVPGFSAPYRTVPGQIVMAALLAGSVVLLVWMRRLALGQRAPRFLGTTAGTP